MLNDCIWFLETHVCRCSCCAYWCPSCSASWSVSCSFLLSFLQLKQRLLSFSPHIQTASGEREIDLERFLYLSCRSFRSAQRRFKRALKKNLKLDNNQYGEKRKHVTESEFVESVLHVEPRWLPHQARAIFQQGQQQLAEQHAQEGRSINNIVVALEDRLRLLLLLLLLL